MRYAAVPVLDPQEEVYRESDGYKIREFDSDGKASRWFGQHYKERKTLLSRLPVGWSLLNLDTGERLGWALNRWAMQDDPRRKS